MIVIIGPATDPHAAAVRDRLGDASVVLDTQHCKITLGARADEIAIDGRSVLPSAVYVRDYGLNPLSARLGGDHWREAVIALREKSDVVHALAHRWEQLGVAMYNPPSSRERLIKPFQLALLVRAGLPVPETRWTNDPDEVRRFAAGRRVAYKPVVGGATTHELEPRDLDRLDRLAAAPVCFQELMVGHDVRVYVLDGDVVCATRIETDAVDFRDDQKALHPYPIDDALRDTCVRAAATLGLRFTAIDLKADAADKLHILELNSSPMFLSLDARAGTDVLGALTTSLSRHR